MKTNNYSFNYFDKKVPITIGHDNKKRISGIPFISPPKIGKSVIVNSNDIPKTKLIEAISKYK